MQGGLPCIKRFILLHFRAMILKHFAAQVRGRCRLHCPVRRAIVGASTCASSCQRNSSCCLTAAARQLPASNSRKALVAMGRRVPPPLHRVLAAAAFLNPGSMSRVFATHTLPCAQALPYVTADEQCALVSCWHKVMRDLPRAAVEMQRAMAACGAYGITTLDLQASTFLHDPYLLEHCHVLGMDDGGSLG